MIGIVETDSGTKQKLRDNLERWKDEFPKRINEALSEVWDKILLTAISICPVDTGTLVTSIKIVEGELGGTGIGEAGGVSYTSMGANEKVVTVFDSSIVAGDETINPKNKLACSVYASIVHDGHFTRSGSYVPPQPFLTDAVDAHWAELEEKINKVLDELDKLE